jgi:hypothetical protein
VKQSRSQAVVALGAPSSRMRVVFFVVAAAIAVALSWIATSPVKAMGTGNPYEDFQVGVTYTVYEPTFTNGLPQRQVQSIDCGSGAGQEDSLSGNYSKNKPQNKWFQGRYFALLQGNPICADGALGANMGTRTINGVKWTINSACLNDGGAACSKAQSRNYKQYGGTLSATMPKVGQAQPTDVRIGFGGMPLPVALKIAQGLSPAN